LEQLIAQIKTERDEINVKLHLAKAEARDQWDVAEKQWHTFKQKSEKVLTEVDHTSGEVKEALSLAADELKKGYRRIREQLR
ncbi:MAG TPA: hypothetical protein VFM32_08960, partial [Spongiibacteraceae bacterium]|nr:hypothetical protein [Spongiibacteraceae bacterium]